MTPAQAEIKTELPPGPRIPTALQAAIWALRWRIVRWRLPWLHSER